MSLAVGLLIFWLSPLSGVRAHLLDTLRSLNSTKYGGQFIFGHQHTNFQGQYWDESRATEPVTRSDVVNTTGKFPGLSAYNLEKLTEHGLDFTPHVLGASQMGAVIAFHWEAHNPVTGGNSHDLSGNPIVELLPGGKGNAKWTQWLSQIAKFFKSVKPKMQGKYKEFIFRPFHEMTGDWYWWGAKAATATQYKEAYQYTRNYLVDKLNVTNLLFAFAPAKPTDHGSAWVDWYPRDKNVDIVCFDRYDAGDGSYEQGLVDDCKAVVSFADAHGKVAAICESGFHAGTQETNDPHWWNKTFFQTVMKHQECARGVTYMQTWTNSAPDNYWTPLPKQLTAEGFLHMAKQRNVLFAADLDEAAPTVV